MAHAVPSGFSILIQHKHYLDGGLHQLKQRLGFCVLHTSPGLCYRMEFKRKIKPITLFNFFLLAW